ncbi:hypothetical protein [Roseovarius salinarum]|uniref:hypothetical protein n=1 Tax=Roseovarius salinarum TaxID=1981892 RepID=UPI0012FFDF08|nr:hypothetical protein [Roseovarius salinarum]
MRFPASEPLRKFAPSIDWTKTVFCCVLINFLLGISAINVYAASIKERDREQFGCDISISGKLKTGDFEKFSNLASKILRRDYAAYKKSTDALDDVWPRMVCTYGPGGSFLEGGKIALLVNEYFATKVPPNENCFSACAVIFMAGTLTHPDNVLYKHFEEACYSNCEGWNPEPRRILYPTSRLGFHAPFVDFKGQKVIPADKVTEYIQNIQRLTIFLLSEAKDNFPVELAAEMMNRGKNDLFMVNEVGQLSSWKIRLQTDYAPKLNVDTLKRAWMMFACKYDHSNCGYGAVSDTKFGGSQDVATPNDTTGWDDAFMRFDGAGRTAIAASGVGGEASFGASLTKMSDAFVFKVFSAFDSSDIFLEQEIPGWMLVDPTTRIEFFARQHP